MNASALSELAGLLREAILWAKILTGVVSLVGLPVLLWAWSVTRGLDELKAGQHKHDDTLHDLARVGDNFSGVFKGLRKIETQLLALEWTRRPPRS